MPGKYSSNGTGGKGGSGGTGGNGSGGYSGGYTGGGGSGFDPIFSEQPNKMVLPMSPTVNDIVKAESDGFVTVTNTKIGDTYLVPGRGFVDAAALANLVRGGLVKINVNGDVVTFS